MRRHFFKQKFLANEKSCQNQTITILEMLINESGKEFACQSRQHRRCGFDPWVRKIPWRREWQPTSVLLPGVVHGQRSLVGCKESDTTQRLINLVNESRFLPTVSVNINKREKTSLPTKGNKASTSLPCPPHNLFSGWPYQASIQSCQVIGSLEGRATLGCNRPNPDSGQMIQSIQ